MNKIRLEPQALTVETSAKIVIKNAAANSVLVEMLKASFTPREIRMRLRELEFDEKEAEKVFPL